MLTLDRPPLARCVPAQDAGNSNYSLHMRREDFHRASTAQLVARALNDAAPLGLTAQRGVSLRAPPLPADAAQAAHVLASLPRGVYANERNDLCVSLLRPSDARTESELQARGQLLPCAGSDRALPHDPLTVQLRKPFERKISGSAYKITSSRAYHHGTMLLSAHLDQLGGSLSSALARAAPTTGQHTLSPSCAPPAPVVRLALNKSVSSVRAPVTSLLQAFPHLSAFVSAEQQRQGRQQQQQQGKQQQQPPPPPPPPLDPQSLLHEHFVRAVTQEFFSASASASAEGQIHVVDKHTMLDADPDLRQIYTDLSTWEWTFGQTPEFQLALVYPPPPAASPDNLSASASASEQVGQEQRGRPTSEPRSDSALSAARHEPGSSSSSEDAAGTPPSWLKQVDLTLHVRHGRIQAVHIKALALSPTTPRGPLDPGHSGQHLRDTLVHWVTQDWVGLPFDRFVVSPPVSLHGHEHEQEHGQGQGPTSHVPMSGSPEVATMQREWLAWVRQVLV